jgi:hypothetical protein
MTMVHPVDPHHFVCTSSMVSGRLVEAFAKNSKPKGFEDIVPTTLHKYANVLSETAFDSLPERCKWDHTIELEREPSPGFRKVYPMTLTEQMEMDAGHSTHHAFISHSTTSRAKAWASLTHSLDGPTMDQVRETITT